MSLSFAPELNFVGEKDGNKAYQLTFHCNMAGNPFFPEVRGFQVSVVEKESCFIANIRDSIGLNFTTQEFSKEEFPGKWREFMNKLSRL